MRRRTKIRGGVERFSLARTVEAIDRAEIAALVFDAEEGLTVEDRKIASRVIEAGRGLLLIANKWDQIEHKDDRYQQLREEAGLFARATVLRTSALSGRGVNRIPPVLLDLASRWRSRVTTAKLNEILGAAQRERPTARDAGNLHYATQVATGPPTVVIFGGGRAPDAGYRRYLENRLRRELGLEGIPIKLRFRSRKGRAPRGRTGG